MSSCPGGSAVGAWRHVEAVWTVSCQATIVLVGAALFAAACGTQRVTVRGNAMAPTLNDGDHALMVKEVAPLRRGDIVAFRYPRDESKNFVQRIVAVPGETVEVRSGRVSINGAAIDEPYVDARHRSNDAFGPLTLQDAQYFVMGDNRRNASDSRSWGPVAEPLIYGKLLR